MEIKDQNLAKSEKAILLFAMVNCKAFSAGIIENGHAATAMALESTLEFVYSLNGFKTAPQNTEKSLITSKKFKTTAFR